MKRYAKKLEHFIRRKLNNSKNVFHDHIIHSIEDAIPLAPQCKILILRIDKFGDMIVTIPIIREIRKKFPHATIDIVLGQANKSLSSNALVYANSILYYDKTLLGLIRLLYQMRKTKYDICIDPLDNPSITSGNLCYLSNATYTVGLYKSNAKKYTHCIIPKDRLKVHIVERTAQMLLAFGIDPEVSDLDCEFQLEQSYLEKSSETLKNIIDLQRPVIAINTTGSIASRTMNKEFAIALYKEIHDIACSFEAQILLFGPESQSAVLSSIQEHTNCLIAPFTTSFNEYAAMLKCASIIISPDTSAVHLAASWKTPTVCLFCKDNTGTALWTPYHTRHECVISETYSINDIDIYKISNSLNEIVKTSNLQAANIALMS